jgi:hypothetical protein
MCGFSLDVKTRVRSNCSCLGTTHVRGSILGNPKRLGEGLDANPINVALLAVRQRMLRQRPWADQPPVNKEGME